MIRSVLAAAALALAACTPAPPEAPPAPPPPDVADAAPTALLTGAFAATSTTAMGVTGDLTVEPTRLSFGKGFLLETETAGLVDVTTLTKMDGDSFAKTMTLPTSLAMELRRVIKVTNAADAAPQPLCGAAAPTWVALAYDTPVTAVSMGVFSGIDAPSPAGIDTTLCGTFTYDR